MTDVRTQITEALREHYLWPEGQDGSDHLADVLLSLPGIAIVEVPEGMRVSLRYDRDAEIARLDAAEQNEPLNYSGLDRSCDSYYGMG